MEALDNFRNSRLFNKHGLNIAWGIGITLLILVILYIAWVSYSLAEKKKLHYAPQQITNNNKPAQKSYNINKIVSANLFGDPTPAPVVKTAPKKTTLNLTLQGILSGTHQNIARAIISSGNRPPKVYAIGKQIEGAGATIKEIKPSEVLLDRNGAIESLPLKKKSKSDKPIISYVGENLIDEPEFPQSDNYNSATDRPKPERISAEERARRMDEALKKMGNL